MKQTSALLEFADALDMSILEAIGLVDQLKEIEKEDRYLEFTSEAFIEMFIRRSIPTDKDRLICLYREYERQNKQILARDRKRKQRQR